MCCLIFLYYLWKPQRFRESAICEPCYILSQIIFELIFPSKKFYFEPDEARGLLLSHLYHTMADVTQLEVLNLVSYQFPGNIVIPSTPSSYFASGMFALSIYRLARKCKFSIAKQALIHEHYSWNDDWFPYHNQIHFEAPFNISGIIEVLPFADQISRFPFINIPQYVIVHLHQPWL